MLEAAQFPCNALFAGQHGPLWPGADASRAGALWRPSLAVLTTAGCTGLRCMLRQLLHALWIADSHVPGGLLQM